MSNGTNAIAGSTIVMETSAYLTCGILVLSTVYAMLRMCRGSKVAFLISLTALLFASNLCYIIYIALYNDRRRL